MVIGDWGTAGRMKKHFGGTPLYASSFAFKLNPMKDLFAFGQIAFELYFDEAGKIGNL